MNPQQIIKHIVGIYLVPGKQYPQPLPAELQPWYCYTRDGGHSIVCAIKSLYRPGGSPDDFLVTVPVKTVLRGYSQQNGYILVDVPYNSQVGLMVPEEDDEF